MHEGHRQRLKNRFLKEGIDSFEPHEILELLLFYAIPRSDTNPIAHRLMDEFGSLSRVLEADPSDLAKVEGINQHSALLLHMVPSLFRVYNQDKWSQRAVLATSRRAGEFARSLFGGRVRETLIVISLNKSRQVLNWKVVNEGELSETLLSQRVVVEEALQQKACGIILAHNHPSGTLRPSYEDQIATKDIQKTLSAMHIELVDHIIVAGEKYVSMGDIGML